MTFENINYISMSRVASCFDALSMTPIQTPTFQ